MANIGLGYASKAQAVQDRLTPLNWNSRTTTPHEMSKTPMDKLLFLGRVKSDEAGNFFCYDMISFGPHY